MGHNEFGLLSGDSKLNGNHSQNKQGLFQMLHIRLFLKLHFESFGKPGCGNVSYHLMITDLC